MTPTQLLNVLLAAAFILWLLTQMWEYASEMIKDAIEWAQLTQVQKALRPKSDHPVYILGGLVIVEIVIAILIALIYWRTTTG